MKSFVAYGAALLIFGIVDAMWLWIMSSRIYRPTLGDMLLSDLRIAPALLFYVMYPAGLVFFAIAPALRSADWGTATVNGAILGLVAYGTYDLTNYATLRNWSLSLTLIDIAYGVALSASVAFTGYMAARAIG